MGHCCAPANQLAQDGRRRRVLWMVLAINAGMFFVELSAGLWAGSVALQADSLDMLGDAVVYGVTLATIGGSVVRRARAAQLKGLCMAGFGVVVLGQIGWKVIRGGPPDPFVVSSIGVLALLANLGCLGLLYAHRADDLNMRSAWLCSRNDLAANTAVIFSAGGVAFFASIWPDVLVSLAIVMLFLVSAERVIAAATRDIRMARAGDAGDLCRNGVCPATACRCSAA